MCADDPLATVMLSSGVDYHAVDGALVIGD
jgi:hypothetical protein